MAEETAFIVGLVHRSPLKEDERLSLLKLVGRLEECILRKGNKYLFFCKFMD